MTVTAIVNYHTVECVNQCKNVSAFLSQKLDSTWVILSLLGTTVLTPRHQQGSVTLWWPFRHLQAHQSATVVPSIASKNGEIAQSVKEG